MALGVLDKALSDGFAGRLIHRGDDAYEASRLHGIFHIRYPARFPAAVLKAMTEVDVIQGVLLAKEKGWKIAVRSGGHSFPVWSLRDDGLMIDLGQLKEISYDEATGIAAIGPAVHIGDELNPYLVQFGRFFAGGTCPTVAAGGFLLQGGKGWNFRGWGFAAENLVAADVVTAGGDLLHVDERENPDLFWAVRGAGPGFCGVVTRFYLRTRPIPKAMMRTMQVYPVDLYIRVLPWLFEAQKNISSQVHILAGSMIPPFAVPGHGGGLVFYVLGLAFSDSQEDAIAALRPLENCPFLPDALLIEVAKPTSLPEQVALSDAIHPAGLHYRVDSAWVEGDYDAIARACRTLVMDRPQEELGHTFFSFALPREAPDMAMSLVTEIMMGAYVIYENEEDDEKYQGWLRDAMRQLEPFTVGQYWGDSDQEYREVKCLSDAAYERLLAIRKARDPDELFAVYLAGKSGFRNINGWNEASEV